MRALEGLPGLFQCDKHAAIANQHHFALPYEFLRYKRGTVRALVRLERGRMYAVARPALLSH